jgi:hypothetical protein
LSEGVNKDFLGRHFERAKGNLYEGDHNDVTDKLDKDSGDDHKDQPDLQALANAAREADPTQRWQRLQKVLDVDRFAAFLATEVLVWHTSGYALKTNKYRIYHDPASDKLVFIPHGIDVAFAKVDGPLFPEMAGLVARVVLQTPEGKRLYRERMAKLLSGPVKADTIQTRLNELAGRIRPTLTKSDPAAAKGLDAAVTQLRERMAQRAYFLEQELKKSQ